jgi:NADH-quinone oxidoreductase subunit K
MMPAGHYLFLSFALFIIADASSEAAVGLGIIIAFFRNRETVLADEMDLLKW